MAIEIRRAPVDEIMPLRELYRQEMNCQIVHDAYAARGFSEAYLILAAGRIAGYGLVGRQHEMDTVHEFHTLSPHRSEALAIFRQLLEASQARRIRAPTNDRLM